MLYCYHFFPIAQLTYLSHLPKKKGKINSENATGQISHRILNLNQSRPEIILGLKFN